MHIQQQSPQLDVNKLSVFASNQVIDLDSLNCKAQNLSISQRRSLQNSCGRKISESFGDNNQDMLDNEQQNVFAQGDLSIESRRKRRKSSIFENSVQNAFDKMFKKKKVRQMSSGGNFKQKDSVFKRGFDKIKNTIIRDNKTQLIVVK